MGNSFDGNDKEVFTVTLKYNETFMNIASEAIHQITIFSNIIIFSHCHFISSVVKHPGDIKTREYCFKTLRLISIPCTTVDEQKMIRVKQLQVVKWETG